MRTLVIESGVRYKNWASFLFCTDNSLKSLDYLADVCYTMVEITDKYIRQAVKSILRGKNDVCKSKITNISKNENDNNADNLFRWCIDRNIFDSLSGVFRIGVKNV